MDITEWNDIAPNRRSHFSPYRPKTAISLVWQSMSATAFSTLITFLHWLAYWRLSPTVAHQVKSQIFSCCTLILELYKLSASGQSSSGLSISLCSSVSAQFSSAGQGTGADIWSSRGTRWTEEPFPKARIFSAMLTTFSSVAGLLISSNMISAPPSFSNIGQYLLPITTKKLTLYTLLTNKYATKKVFHTLFFSINTQDSHHWIILLCSETIYRCICKNLHICSWLTIFGADMLNCPNRPQLYCWTVIASQQGKERVKRPVEWRNSIKSGILKKIKTNNSC